MKIPASVPSLVTDPSTYTFQTSSISSADLVVSCKKSVKACALIDTLASKSTSYSVSSIAYFTVLPDKSGFHSTCFKGTLVLTTTL